MPTNEATKGYRGVYAFGKAADWGTPVLLSTNHGLEIHSNGINSDIQNVDREDELSGSGQSRAGDKGTETHRGTLVAPAKYETLTTLLALATGVAGAPTQQGGVSAYKHALNSILDPAGKFGTYVEDYQLHVHEYPSVKVTGFDFEIDAKTQKGKFSFPMVFDKMNVNAGTGTNKTSTIAAITMHANRSRVLFSQGVFLMNDQTGIDWALTGGTLNIGDKQLINSFKLSYRRPYLEDDFNAERGYLISEPHQNGKTTCSVTLGFSKFATDNAARLAEVLAQTEKKLKVAFTGPICAGAVNYSLTFWLNAVQFSGRPTINSGGVAPWSLEGKAHEVASLATGMPTNYTQMLHVDLVNSLSSDPLA